MTDFLKYEEQDAETLTLVSQEVDTLGTQSYFYGRPDKYCLAPLASRKGYVCIRPITCRLKGHVESREQSYPASGYRPCEVNAEGKVTAVRSEGYLTIDNFRIRREVQGSNEDEEAFLTLQDKLAVSLQTPPGNITVRTSVDKLPTTRMGNRKANDLHSTSTEPEPSSEYRLLMKQHQELLNAMKTMLSQGERKEAPASVPIATSPRRSPHTSQSFYAIGPTSMIPGIYTSLDEVREILAMDTTVKPQVRRFGTELEANDWLDHLCITTKDTTLSPPALIAESYTSRPQKQNRPQEESAVRSYFDNRPLAEIQRELAIDDSRVKEGAAFGTTIISEQDAEDLLSPSDLNEEAAKRLQGKILDATALPNLTLPTATEAEESLLASSLMIVATRGGMHDPQVHLPKRTALYTIKTLKSLQKLAKHLGKASKRAQLSTTGAMARVFQNAGVPRTFANFRATKSLAHRISLETLRFYQELVTHLLELNVRIGWESTLVELQHHAEEISSIRTSTTSRTHTLLLIYIYLRNGAHQRWQSSRLLSARVDAILDPDKNSVDTESQSGTGSTSDLTVSTATGGTKICPHCNSSLHPFGTPCLFQRLKREKARKAAKAYQKRLVDEAIKASEDE